MVYIGVCVIKGIAMVCKNVSLVEWLMYGFNALGFKLDRGEGAFFFA